ncbi:13786_t:CDS:1 [Funneliformis mosseae]|uniref:13786_t:CDS:1 n=1 Tax=Funneliformis mosseae TaxID=27381 RepID=A0A9N9DAM1_FUNMO|nr:13786_t:CDS:1 [Funneliformis mosseae]
MQSDSEPNFTSNSPNPHVDNDPISQSVNAIQNTIHNEMVSHVLTEPHVVINSEHQQNSNMQPMSSSHTVPKFQVSSYSTNYIQENVNMARHSFFYRPCNDDHIYHIICEETTFEETISQLINNYLYSSNSSNSFLFYFQQPNDKRIYQVVCEMIYIYSNEIKPNEQQHVEFSNRHKENLEIYLRQFLVIFLAPMDIYGQLNMNIEQDRDVDNGTGGSNSNTSLVDISQFSISQQDNNNQKVSSQNVSENYMRDNNSE